jgi:hypothetical protein
MTDIDFDELDQAVNSLMGNASVKNESSEQSKTDEPMSIENRGLDLSQSNKPIQSNSEQPVSIVPKRRGQFMDVMHPSSDMKTTDKALIKNRTQTNITPSSAGLNASIEEKSVLDTQQSSQETKPDVNIEAKPSQQNNDDVLDMDQMDESVSQVANSENSQPGPRSEPPKSPFLPDAKVEKTPLGSSAPTTTLDSNKDAASILADKEGQDDTTNEDSPGDELLAGEEEQIESGTIPVALPAEFASDILSIESDRPPTGVAEVQDLKISDMKPDVQSSIVQQYKVKSDIASTEDHAPLYDSIVQPLGHPTKKKSGWLTIVIIIFIILLGVGGAAAAYLFGLL